MQIKQFAGGWRLKIFPFCFCTCKQLDDFRKSKFLARSLSTDSKDKTAKSLLGHGTSKKFFDQFEF